MIQFLIDSVIYKHEIEVARDEANIIDEESSGEKKRKKIMIGRIYCNVTFQSS